jgi:protein required for attachment to host cells
MSKIGIVVADARRARFLTLTLGGEPQPGTADLIEQQELRNPEVLAPPSESFRDSGGAAGADARWGGHWHGYLRRFAQRMIERTRLFIADPSLEQLIIVAEPHLLGVARLELEHEPLRRVRVCQLAADLSQNSSLEIRELLATRGLLPAVCSPRVVTRTLLDREREGHQAGLTGGDQARCMGSPQNVDPAPS